MNKTKREKRLRNRARDREKVCKLSCLVGKYRKELREIGVATRVRLTATFDAIISSQFGFRY